LICLRPFPADEMEAFEVSKDVGGNVKKQLARAAQQLRETNCGQVVCAALR
jgi:hypothetical protein